MKKLLRPSYLITIISILAATILALLNSSVLTWMIWLSTILGLFSSQFLSEAKIGSFIFEILSYAVYIYVCVKLVFWGELILSCIIIVLHLIFEWKKHLINKQVEVSKIKKLEVAVSIGISVLLGILYSIFLYKINSALPILNAIPTITYLLSCYYCYRRSILQFVCTILYEISFMVLWVVQASWGGGEIGNLIFLIGGIYEFIYGFISIYKWNKLQKEQKNKP